MMNNVQLSPSANRILGLDIGTSSVGWALLIENGDCITDLIATGVRIFPDGINPKTKEEQTAAKDRRKARLMRRQVQRRTQRKRDLLKAFIHLGLLSDPAELKAVTEDPWLLRAAAVRNPLPLPMLCRALQHLNVRRGFKPNRKADKGAEKEESATGEKAQTLTQQIIESGKRTPGEYFAEFAQTNKVVPVRVIRNKRPDAEFRILKREQLEAEFDLIWATQSPHHPTALTSDVRDVLRRIIFFQRPLKSVDHLVGFCEFEPDQRRARRASWLFQHFRILQDLTNLRITQVGKEEVSLTDEQRRTLLKELSEKKELSANAALKKIKLDRDSHTLSIEKPNKQGKLEGKLRGNEVEVALRSIFPDFEQRAETICLDIWPEVLRGADNGEFRKKAPELGLTAEQTDQLIDAEASLPDGYCYLSIKALEKLVPLMEQGLDYYQAQKALGYLDRAPDAAHEFLPASPQGITNPIVRRALVEVRTVVNAIIREYGKPTRITVELARETKGTSRDREEIRIKNNQREKEKEAIRKRLREEFGIPHPSSTDILKYELWQEQDEKSPFSGRIISKSDLYNGNAVQIEHILPFSRSLDDGRNNKVVCFTQENVEKGQQTPREWLGQDEQRFAEMLVTVNAMKKLPYPKRKRFEQKEIDIDECIARQLNDTRYISREVRFFLQKLYSGTQAQLDQKVRVTRGDVTAHLRYLWGLNKILSADGTNQKNRGDHRHHAVDAVVVACTTPSHIKNLSRRYEFKKEGDGFPEPFEGFWKKVKSSIDTILISFRQQKKTNGALHEETSYGATREPGVYTTRKKIKDLTAAMVEEIRDERLRQMIKQRIEQVGDHKKALAEPFFLPNRKHPQHPIPVYSVRITKKLGKPIAMKRPDGTPFRYVEPGGNHHATFFELRDKKGNLKREAFVYTRFEVMQRVAENRRRKKRGEPLLPIIDRNHPTDPNARFLFSLAINEMVRAGKPGEEQKLYRVQKFHSTGAGTINITLRLSRAATIDNESEMLRITSLDPAKTSLRKVSIDPLGREFPAHD